MKKISFFIQLAALIIYFGCNKHDHSSSTQANKSKSLVAIAGRDTSICMPYGGTGHIFQGILDGQGSHDSLGNIVSYDWKQMVPGTGTLIDVGSKALTEVEISNPGINTFWLEVKDDQGQVAYDSVSINIIQNFTFEYDGLSWDSAVGALTTISESFKPGLIESWPDFTKAIIDQSTALITNYNGQCVDIASWKVIPYVPYDSIQLTPVPLFYTIIPGHGVLFPEIFAKTNAAIDFNQQVSIAFDLNSGQGGWDY
ncbi:MAG TPA: hypothetical protein VKR53_03780 [Puia sp.]|nr:hypothetical protein [Puia sp.]